MGDECVFCKIVNGEASSERLYESENFIVIKNINPKTEGHCLVIPKEHYQTTFEMPSNLGNEMIQVIQEQGKKLLDLGSEGIKTITNNYPAAGQVIHHLHVHMLPMGQDTEFGSIV
ncbi:MAG: HIT family protein [Candidatus Pacearchaeota archaeon]